MNNLVLDASFTLAWCFGDQATEVTSRIRLELPECTFYVPNVLWELETSNALLVALRHRRIAPADLEKNRALLDALPIVPVSFAVSRAFEIAIKHQRSSYDACYLAVAEETGFPIATLDGGIRQACIEAGLALLE